MNSNERYTPPTLDELRQMEEKLREATAEAQKEMGEGKTTPAVFEELRGKYFMAKQAREDFERSN
jgi:hypothetical protein